MAYNSETKLYGQGTDAQMLSALGVFGITDSSQRSGVIKDTIASISEAYKQVHQLQLQYIKDEYKLRSDLEAEIHKAQNYAHNSYKNFYEQLNRDRLKHLKDWGEQERKNAQANYKEKWLQDNKLREYTEKFLKEQSKKRINAEQGAYQEFYSKASSIASDYINSMSDELKENLSSKELQDLWKSMANNISGIFQKQIKDAEEQVRLAQQEQERRAKQLADSIVNIIRTSLRSAFEYGTLSLGMESFGHYNARSALQQGNQSAYDFRKAYGAYGMNTFKDMGEVMVEAQRSLQERGLAIGPQQMTQTISRLDKSYALAMRTKEDLESILESAAAIEKGVSNIDANSQLAKMTSIYGGTDQWKTLEQAAYQYSAYYKDKGISVDPAYIMSQLQNNTGVYQAFLRDVALSGGDKTNMMQRFISDIVAPAFSLAAQSGGIMTQGDSEALEQSLQIYSGNAKLSGLNTTGIYAWGQYQAGGRTGGVQDILNSAETIGSRVAGYGINPNGEGFDIYGANFIGSNTSLGEIPYYAQREINRKLLGNVGNAPSYAEVTKYGYPDISAQDTAADLATATKATTGFNAGVNAAGTWIENVSLIADKVTEISNAIGINTIISGLTNMAGPALSKVISGGISKALNGAGLSLAGGAAKGGAGLSAALSGLGASLSTVAAYAIPIAAVLGTTYAAIKTMQDSQESSNAALESGLPGFFEANGMVINKDGVAGMPVISYEAKETKEDTGTHKFTQYSYNANSGALSSNVVNAEEGNLTDYQNTSAGAVYQKMANTKIDLGRKTSQILAPNPNGGGYITPDELYGMFTSGQITYDQFISSAAQAKKSEYDIGEHKNIPAALAEKYQVLSKEERAKLFWDEIANTHMGGPNSAFARLLAIYNNPPDGSESLLFKDGSSLFNWDNQTVNFINKFDEYYRAYTEADGPYVYNNNDKRIKIASPPWPGKSAVYGNYNAQDYKKEIIDTASKYNLLANGISAVPYNGFPALLHQGEMVLPSKKANYIRALFGAKPLPSSGVPEDINTGTNSFVQSLPDYRQSMIPLEGGADDAIPAFAAGDDAVAYMQNLAQQGITYKQMDCSDSVAAAYKAAGVGVKASDNCRDIYKWDKYGFSFLYNAANNGNQRLTASGLSALGLKTGDVILMDLKANNGRYPDHVSLVSSPGSMIHSYKSWDNRGLGGPHVSGYWNNAIAVLRYGSGSNGKVNLDLNNSQYFTNAGNGGLSGFSNLNFGNGNFSFIENMDLLQRLSGSNPYIASVLGMLGITSGSNTNSIINNVGAISTRSTNNRSVTSNISGSPYKDLLIKYGNQIGVDPDLLFGMMMAESSGNPNTVTGSYKGLMQVNQAKVDALFGANSGRDIYDPETNIAAAVNYLATKCIPKTGYVSLGIGGYNAGPNYQSWQTAANILNQGGDWSTILAKMQETNSSSAMSGNPNTIKTRYIKSVYKYAGLPLEVPYLARGGIVDSPVLSMIGEGQNPEAVTPLDQDNKLLGLDSMTDSLLDGLDSVCGHLLRKMDEIIGAIHSSQSIYSGTTGTNYSSSQTNRMDRIKHLGAMKR